MGTLSYLRLAQGYSLMLNRDALPQRPRVENIAQASVAGDAGAALRLLYPVDPPSGGTWVGVNDRGAAFALLDLSVPGVAALAAPASRGRLIPEALRAPSAGGGLERVAALDLGATAPFQLVGLEEGHAPLSLLWDGRALQRRLHPDGALLLGGAARATEWILNAADEAELLVAQEAYHLAKWGQAASFTQVLVLRSLVVLRYWDRAARELGQDAETISIKRSI